MTGHRCVLVLSDERRRRRGRGLDRATLTVAGVVILGAIMSILDATVVNVALETLARELGSPLTSIQWVISGYTLALAMVIPVSGWAADRFTARRTWLASVALFAAASALCAAAWSDETLIVFRVLQGAAGGLLTPVGTIMIAKAAGPQRMGQVMAVMGVPMLLGPVLGPVIGGVLVQAASWWTRSNAAQTLPKGENFLRFRATALRKHVSPGGVASRPCRR